MNIKDGGPAFPNKESTELAACSGMTIRDYFAAEAIKPFMAAMLVSPQVGVNDSVHKASNRYAEFAYFIADAMLAERAK